MENIKKDARKYVGKDKENNAEKNKETLSENKKKYIVGIDEVGKGPVAGPVVLCACIFENKNKTEVIEKLSGISDSKKLSSKKRMYFLKKIKKLKQENKLQYFLNSLDAEKIDRLGISFCIKKCIEKNLIQIENFFHDKKNFGDKKNFHSETLILLDGNLRAPEKFTFQKTIIKGDEKEIIISIASIIAKIYRDDFMEKQADKFPQYFFEKHKGYGTKTHLEKVQKYGICPLHRKSFLKKYL